jgi:hypothetical protein
MAVEAREFEELRRQGVSLIEIGEKRAMGEKGSTVVVYNEDPEKGNAVEQRE